jgi:hypothetical protein
MQAHMMRRLALCHDLLDEGLAIGASHVTGAILEGGRGLARSGKGHPGDSMHFT